MRARLQGRWIAGLIAAGVLVGGLTGCVSQKEYDLLMETNRSLTSQNAEMRAQLDSFRQQNDRLGNVTSSANTTIEGLQAENAELRSMLQGARATIDSMEERLATLDFVALDPATNMALARLARQNPGLITYDPDRGMLRFSSDLTFNSGSDEVKAEAASSLAALADVMNAAEAAGYDLRIVGHTDSEAISSRTAQRHPTNMHLSAHRAIAVVNVLGGQGISWDRMSATGWSKFRPIVPNNPTGGTASNRRVEIFVVPSTRDSIEAGAPSATANVDNEQAPARIDPTK